MVTRMRQAGSARRFGAGLILLALWLQTLAPAAGVLTRARQAEAATADALIHAVLCGQGEGQGQGQGVSVAAELPTEGAACDCCPLCRCTAAAPLPVVPDVTAVRLVWRRVAWPTPPPTRGLRPPRRAVQARAPPGTV